MTARPAACAALTKPVYAAPLGPQIWGRDHEPSLVREGEAAVAFGLPPQFSNTASISFSADARHAWHLHLIINKHQ
jgi:hypothetical protein